MVYWDKCVENFYKFKECKARLCAYHGYTHYADRVIVERQFVNSDDFSKYVLVSKYLYHSHKIAEFDGNILTISACGFLTQTTRDRLDALTPSSFSVHLGCRVEVTKYGRSWYPILMYIYDKHEGKSYLITDGWKDYKIKIDVKSNKIINKNELKEVVKFIRWIKSKDGLIKDIDDKLYVKLDYKYLIRLSDLKTFKHLDGVYAVEETLNEVINNVDSLKDLLKIIKERNKRLYLRILTEV